MSNDLTFHEIITGTVILVVIAVYVYFAIYYSINERRNKKK